MKKPTLLPLVRLCGAALVMATFAACSGAANSPPSAPGPAAAPVAKSTLIDQIKTEIGTAACDSAQQCKTVAIGHKACGGPESYMAYSTKRSDAAKIIRLAAAYETESRSQNLQSGRISTCQMTMDPGATCSAGTCVSGQGANAPQVR
ncbi:MAG: hypothetical protein V4631_00360 [Pseudomonadota bacterium]